MYAWLQIYSFFQIFTSHNNTVRYTAIYRLNEFTSTMGRNMTHLKYKYDLQMEEFISLTKNKISFHCYTKWLANISDEYTIYASIIQDMLMMKEERCHRTFSDDECDFIIKFLCTIWIIWLFCIYFTFYFYFFTINISF